MTTLDKEKMARRGRKWVKAMMKAQEAIKELDWADICFLWWRECDRARKVEERKRQ